MLTIARSNYYRNTYGSEDNATSTYDCIARAFPFDLTSLTVLEVDFNAESADDAQALVDRCKDTLLCLCFQVNGGRSLLSSRLQPAYPYRASVYVVGTISLGGLRNVRSIMVVVSLETFTYSSGPGECQFSFFDIMETLDPLAEK